MALVLADRVQETTTTSGTGTLTLGGAVSGYRSFGSGIGVGNTTYYCIYDQTAQVWEIGLGTVGSGTLARTTVYSNSSGNTSPLTLAGNTASVFAVYTASKTVNLDDSGNVTALGNVTSATWQGSTVGVAYGGTGVTASSGANSVVLRDANSNINFNNFIAGASATTAAGTTTILTASSSRTQILVGSTNQTFQLPNATTLSLGQSFIFVNNSTGTLTVKDNASTTVETVPSGGITQLGATSIATSAGTWGAYSFIPAAVDWGTNALNLASTVVSGGTWQGGTIQPAYGGTGLTNFTAANYALYSTSSSALTAGTLPVPAGGTGQTTFASGYIPYGNTTAALQSSASLQFNGTYLVVGGTSPLGGATNPITAFSSSANNYVQTYVYNATGGTSSSADFVAYANNSTDAHGWADMGFTSSTYADATYTCTGPNEAYIFGSAPANVSATGNLVYATDSTGTANAHQWYVGGFTQAKGAWKMQLTSTDLQVATTTSLGTASAQYIQNVGDATYPQVKAAGSGTNIPLVLQPKGTGALQAQLTDSTATGGNARGANAVDWQTYRTTAAQVASGAYTTISGGSRNTASAAYSSTLGGDLNTNSGIYSTISGGYNNTAQSYMSTVSGGALNASNGYYNFIGSGYANSGTSASAVTTQSATMNGTTAVTLSSSNAAIKVGQYINGTSIAAQTYVAAISGTSLTLSQAASGSSTSTLSFYTPHGVVVGGGNNQATGSYSFIGGGGDAGTAANRNVASGDWSCVLGGFRNTASGFGAWIGTNNNQAGTNAATGSGSVILSGTNNISSNNGTSVLSGYGNTASGNYTTVMGTNGTSRSINGNIVFAACDVPLGNQGSSQSALLVLGVQTTDATATVLRSNTAVAGTSNQVILPNNSAYYFKVRVISGVTAGGNTKAWTLEGAIKRGANAASTAIVGSVTTTVVAADAGASTWTVTATADTTNGGLAITFTGQAGTTIRTVAKVETVEMTY